MRKIAFFLLSTLCAAAEVKTLTLRQALDLALAQNPDLMLARLDQQKARQQVIITHDPFVPKVFAGSGAAKTWGYPASVDSNAPSILQTRTQWTLFDRSQSYQVAAARENVRTSEIDAGRQQDEVVYRIASLYLDAEQAALSRQAAEREVENLQRVFELVQARVAEKREIPLEASKANLALQKAKNAVESLALDSINAETALAMALGLAPDDRVRAAAEERPALAVPVSEDQSIESAIELSPELKRLESAMQSKRLEIKGYKAARLPRVNVVAQYELLGKYYYQNYYQQFQTNNGQLGASIDVPLLAGPSSRAYVQQAEIEIAKMKIEVDRTRSRITADLRRAFQEVKRAESARDYARADLDVVRDQLSIDLAQYHEGRLPMAAVEQARALENEKWLAFYEAQHTAERARLSVLRQTGTLQAALK